MQFAGTVAGAGQNCPVRRNNDRPNRHLSPQSGGAGFSQGCIHMTAKPVHPAVLPGAARPCKRLSLGRDWRYAVGVTPDDKPKAKPARSDAPAKDGERIAKVLARAGVASRREAERMIALGRVAVNGALIDSPALNVTAADRITLDDKPIAAAEPARLWLYYKPLGLVTSERDEKGRATVFDNLPEALPRVLSIGRLDLNSEGLLLLTNDGEIKRRLELPATGWLRKYRVRVNGTPTEDMLAPLRDGLTVDGIRFQGMTVSIDKIQGANAWLTVGIREGKNREIRRAINHIGLIVNRLIRTGYGPFKLGVMEPGQVEEVKARVLRDQLGLGAPEEPALKPKVRHSRPAPRSEGRPDMSGPAQAARPPRPASAGPSRQPVQKPGPKRDQKPEAKSGTRPGPKPGPRSGKPKPRA